MVSAQSDWVYPTHPVNNNKYYTLVHEYSHTIQFNLPYPVKCVIGMPDLASDTLTPPRLEIQLPNAEDSTSLALAIQPPNAAIPKLIGCLQLPMWPFNWLSSTPNPAIQLIHCKCSPKPWVLGASVTPVYLQCQGKGKVELNGMCHVGTHIPKYGT
jgi:hypothetical protein